MIALNPLKNKSTALLSPLRLQKSDNRRLPETVKSTNALARGAFVDRTMDNVLESDIIAEVN